MFGTTKAVPQIYLTGPGESSPAGRYPDWELPPDLRADVMMSDFGLNTIKLFANLQNEQQYQASKIKRVLRGAVNKHAFRVFNNNQTAEYLELFVGSCLGTYLKVVRTKRDHEEKVEVLSD